MEAPFYVVFAVQASLGCAGACCNIIVLRRLCHAHSRMDANVFLLLRVTSVAASAFPLLCFLRATTLLAVGHSFTVQTQQEGRICALVDVPRVLCSTFLSYILLVIACERTRTLSTLRARGAPPHHGEQPQAGLKIGLCTLLLSTFVWTMGYLQVGMPTRIMPVARHCLSTYLMTTSAASGAIVVAVYCAIEIVSLILFIRISRCCKRVLHSFAHRQEHLTLTQRMQLRRTVELTNALLPATKAHVACNLIAYTAWASRIVASLNVRTLPTNLQELPLLIAEIFAILPNLAYCLFYAYYIARLLRLIGHVSFLPCLTYNDPKEPIARYTGRDTVSYEENQSIYFENLQNEWNMKYEQQKSKQTT